MYAYTYSIRSRFGSRSALLSYQFMEVLLLVCSAWTCRAFALAPGELRSNRAWSPMAPTSAVPAAIAADKRVGVRDATSEFLRPRYHLGGESNTPTLLRLPRDHHLLRVLEALNGIMNLKWVASERVAALHEAIRCGYPVQWFAKLDALIVRLRADIPSDDIVQYNIV